VDQLIDYFFNIQEFDDVWPLIGATGVLIWLSTVIYMACRAIIQSRLPENMRKPQGLGFYFLQVIMAFGWVFPMFFMFQIMEFYMLD